MPKNINVQKYSGESEPFSHNKLRKFLQRIQLDEGHINHIVETVENESAINTSTKEIATLTTQLLQQLPHGAMYCARYNIKQHVRELGPDGHQFELFVGKLFEVEDYRVEVGGIERGKCVNHEIDVVAKKDKEIHLVECKFHNKEGTRSDITVAMYTFARFMDIHNAHPDSHHVDYGWLATNTKLTTQAMKYAKCMDMKLLSIEQPGDGNILQRVIKHSLYPVSSVAVLSTYLRDLYQHKVITIHDLLELKESFALKSLGIPTTILQEAQKQAREIINGNGN